jgi:hypothetical protein
MVVISLYLWGLRMTVPCCVPGDRHFTVMEKKVWISDFRTILTLMTVVCGGFLSKGHLALTFTPLIT